MSVFDLFNLKGKVAIVSGGSIGLGSYMATALAEAGADVVIAARKFERCVDKCKELEQLGVKALPVQCDVTVSEDLKNLVDVTVKEFGKIDILVNNAGFSWNHDSLTYPMDKWQKTLDINLTGLYELCMLVANVMKEHGGGKIINMASVAGFIGAHPKIQDTVAYNATKGAVIILNRDLAVKWARYGIYVNGIAPGYFPTHMSQGLLDRNTDIILASIPLRRFGEPDDIKGLVVYLASAASNYMTGQTILIDGGMTCV